MTHQKITNQELAKLIGKLHTAIRGERVEYRRQIKEINAAITKIEKAIAVLEAARIRHDLKIGFNTKIGFLLLSAVAAVSSAAAYLARWTGD